MTFTSNSSAAMKHIEDLSPKFGVEEMEVVNKDGEEAQEEEMDQDDRLAEGKVAMDTAELKEGEVALWFHSLLGCGNFQFIGSHVSSFQNYSLNKAPKVSYDI